MLEVLYDEYFSFALRRRILEKILKSINKDGKQIIKELHQLNTIRNYFAHCGQEIIMLSDEPPRPKIIHPRDIEKELDFESLYADFMNIVEGVEKYLVKLQYDLGVTLITELPES
ncbi:hypothetical protein ES703_36403 [subsurface metagenome]